MGSVIHLGFIKVSLPIDAHSTDSSLRRFFSLASQAPDAVFLVTLGFSLPPDCCENAGMSCLALSLRNLCSSLG